MVAPLLERLGVRASFYVCPGLWGGQSALVTGPAGELITRDEARELSARGMEVASHRLSHPDLRKPRRRRARRRAARLARRDRGGDRAPVPHVRLSVRAARRARGGPRARRRLRARARLGAAARLGSLEVGRLPGPPRHGASRLALKMRGHPEAGEGLVDVPTGSSAARSSRGSPHSSGGPRTRTAGPPRRRRSRCGSGWRKPAIPVRARTRVRRLAGSARARPLHALARRAAAAARPRRRRALGQRACRRGRAGPRRRAGGADKVDLSSDRELAVTASPPPRGRSRDRGQRGRGARARPAALPRARAIVPPPVTLAPASRGAARRPAHHRRCSPAARRTRATASCRRRRRRCSRRVPGSLRVLASCVPVPGATPATARELLALAGRRCAGCAQRARASRLAPEEATCPACRCWSARPTATRRASATRGSASRSSRRRGPASRSWSRRAAAPLRR